MDEVMLFDPKFVHFLWDNTLAGKECFLEDNIDNLKHDVETNYNGFHNKVHCGTYRLPFADDTCKWRFAYYDPNYKVKWAYYKEGKQIQVAYKGANNWVDCDEPEWVDGCQFRVKPEDKSCYVIQDTDVRYEAIQDEDSDSDEQKKVAKPTFQEELRSLLNRFGMDNACNTSDHLLRDYLVNCLENYRIITRGCK